MPIQRMSALLAAAFSLTTLSLAGCVTSTSSTAVADLRQCESLSGMRIPSDRIGLPTSGGVIESAVREAPVAPYKDAEGEHLLTTPAKCLLLGKILPVDPSAPPINFAVNLPLSWNGRALQSGGGGLGGQLITAPGKKASGRFDPNPVNVPYPLAQGYVTFGSDNGHPPMSFAWTKSDEAMRNFAHEELKKTKDVAMVAIEAAYGKRPTHVFFNGESAGGREALRAAQKYPREYDGIIATSPVVNWSANHLADNVLRTRLITGFLDSNAVRLVANQTREKCDAADGISDGVIGRYLECEPDIDALLCSAASAAKDCLTAAQIQAVKVHRQGYVVPVPLANGVSKFLGYQVTGDEDGASFQWRFYVTGQEPPSNELAPGLGWEQRRGGILNFASWWVRHAIAQDPSLNPRDFRAAAYADRIAYLSQLFDATDPDLEAYASRGGKLILVHPSGDNAAPLSASVDYYRSVVTKMGGAEVDRFLRFYVPAGGSHNVGGTSQIDALAMLEDWVIKGVVPPDAPTAYDFSVDDASFKASRPACRFPAYPKYKGSGDPKLAQSFQCTDRSQMK